METDDLPLSSEIPDCLQMRLNVLCHTLGNEYLP